MDTQQQTAAERQPVQEMLEARQETPEQIAREMLRQGDAMVTEAKSGIEDARKALQDAGDEAAREKLKLLEDELDAAWDNLEIATSHPETEEAETEIRDPWIDMLESLDKTFESGRYDPKMSRLMQTREGEQAFRQTLDEKISDKLKAEHLDFATLDRLKTLAQVDGKMREIIKSEFDTIVGPKYSERLLSDQDLRDDLESMLDKLSLPIGKDEKPLCRELGLDQLVLAYEMFGQDAPEAAKHMDLAQYSSELRVQRGEMLMSPQLDKTTGEMCGVISVNFDYGKNPSDGIMHRTFALNKIEKDGKPAFEKSCSLELISLPTNLKGKNTAKQEMAATNKFLKESGFDKEKLHANIDIGGYTWATLGFGWDVEKMRRTGEEGLSDIQIIKNFVTERTQNITMNLKDSGIDLEEPDIKPYMEQLQSMLKTDERAALITPQELAALGKEGPKFIWAVSGKRYRAEDYEPYRESDPPNPRFKGELHFGKLLLLGSDWYGQKQL